MSETIRIASEPYVDAKFDELEEQISNVEKPTDEQIQASVNTYLNSHPEVVGLSNLYVGDTQPTNGVMYWLDTSGDSTGGEEVEPDVPDTPDTPVTYSITRNLTNCKSSKTVTTVTKGTAYTETITANSGYTLTGATVSVTMGGTNISSSYSNGVLNIASVTGNIVITVSAVQETTEPGGAVTYNIVDVATETEENKDAKGTDKNAYIRFKILGVKQGDVIMLAGVNSDNTAGWYDGTTHYSLNNTSIFTNEFQDNYAWKQYTWVADKDYDVLYVASSMYIVTNYPNATPKWTTTSDPYNPDIPDTPDIPEVTLSSISATYTGSDVPVGTALTDLTGITVTGHYSDGSTANITGFTLSGEIVVGSNTITVSYGGKTTTFTVTGVAESSGTVTVNLADIATPVDGYKMYRNYYPNGTSASNHSYFTINDVKAGDILVSTMPNSTTGSIFLGVDSDGNANDLSFTAGDFVDNYSGKLYTCTVTEDYPIVCVNCLTEKYSIDDRVTWTYTR